MPGNRLELSLVVNGRVAWRGEASVAPENCRKMSDPEIKAIAEAARAELRRRTEAKIEMPTPTKGGRK